MRTVLFVLCLTSAFSCKNNSDSNGDTTASIKNSTMKGDWKLISHYNYKDNKV